MGEMENAIAISASLIKTRLEEKADLETPEEIILAAMIAARNSDNTWLLASDDDKVKAALVAAHPFLKEKDQSRLEQELTFFKALGAASTGVPVDFVTVLGGMDKELKPIGVRKLWEEAGGSGGAGTIRSGADSTGQSICVGEKVRFRGEQYTIKAFTRVKGKELMEIAFEEKQHIDEVATEASVDRVRDQR